MEICADVAVLVKLPVDVSGFLDVFVLLLVAKETFLCKVFVPQKSASPFSRRVSVLLLVIFDGWPKAERNTGVCWGGKNGPISEIPVDGIFDFDFVH